MHSLGVSLQLSWLVSAAVAENTFQNDTADEKRASPFNYWIVNDYAATQVRNPFKRPNLVNIAIATREGIRVLKTNNSAVEQTGPGCRPIVGKKRFYHILAQT